MNYSCETCKHANVSMGDYPCRACTHSYTDRWEKATFDDLIDPLLTLAGLQIDKGNHEAVEICKAVIRLIEAEK